MTTLHIKNTDGAILATIDIEGTYRVRETNGVRVEDKDRALMFATNAAIRALRHLRSVKVDCENFQAADDEMCPMGGTTHYGGSIHISDKGGVDIDIRCHGDDRSDDHCYWPTMMAIGDVFGVLIDGEEEQEPLTDELTRQISPGATFQVYFDNTNSKQWRLFIVGEDGELHEHEVSPKPDA